MITIFYVSISVALTVFMALKAKKHLYVHQHESSIKNELETFEKNLKGIKEIDLSNTYKIGSDHIY